MIYETQNRRSEIPKLKSQSYDLHEWAINSKKGWFTSSWPISYKESSNSTMKVHSSNYFHWMGRVRDNSTWLLREELSKDLMSGKCGIVTNNAKLYVCDELYCNDIIESRLSTSLNLSSNGKSTFELCFDWFKLSSQSQQYLPEKKIAESTMQMTWVNILPEGKVQPGLLPNYLQEYVESLAIEEDLKNSKTSYFKKICLGNIIYETESVFNCLLLKSYKFSTSLEDADVIGNINFAVYASLQGRLRDAFFHKMYPENYDRSTRTSEFRCLEAHINYLREAHAFENIEVQMKLEKIFEYGLSLQFEFYRVYNKSERKKIAVSYQKIGWYNSCNTARSSPDKLPLDFLDRISSYIEKDIR
jgi:acyl-CoA thioesterase FadM